METKIIEYVTAHPVLATIFIPIILGILTSFISEAIKQLFFENKPAENKPAKSVFRFITLGISIFLAVMVLGILNGFIATWQLKVLFVSLNAFVPFAFYHLKGKELVEMVISKLFNKAQKTDI